MTDGEFLVDLAERVLAETGDEDTRTPTQQRMLVDAERLRVIAEQTLRDEKYPRPVLVNGQVRYVPSRTSTRSETSQVLGVSDRNDVVVTFEHDGCDLGLNDGWDFRVEQRFTVR